MKRFSRISMLLAIFALSLGFVLTSCQSDNPVSTSTTQSYDLVSFGTLVETPQVSDMTFDNNMKLMNDMEPERVENGALFGGKTPMFRFKQIFDKLNLTDAQKTAIQGYFQSHIDCEKAARLAFFNKISAIMEAANVQRQAILDQLKSGAIDRNTAKQQLAALNESTKAQITATGAIAELQAALKACTDELITNIKSQLTPEQLTLFENWLAKAPSNNGTGVGGGKGNGGGNGNGEGHGKGNGNGEGHGKGGNMGDDHGDMHGKLLYDTLGFTDAQKLSADGFFKAHIECDKSAHDAFNAKVALIFQDARAQQQAIFEQLKAGTIDKATAQALLQKLDEDTKAKIEASGAQAELEAALKLCDDTLKANLESIMTPEQIKLFEELLANNSHLLDNPGMGHK